MSGHVIGVGERQRVGPIVVRSAVNEGDRATIDLVVAVVLRPPVHPSMPAVPRSSPSVDRALEPPRLIIAKRVSLCDNNTYFHTRALQADCSLLRTAGNRKYTAKSTKKKRTDRNQNVNRPRQFCKTTAAFRRQQYLLNLREPRPEPHNFVSVKVFGGGLNDGQSLDRYGLIVMRQ